MKSSLNLFGVLCDSLEYLLHPQTPQEEKDHRGFPKTLVALF